MILAFIEKHAAYISALKDEDISRNWVMTDSSFQTDSPPEYSGYGSYGRTIKKAEPLKRNPP